MTEIITNELLRSWGPCSSGYKRFCELFPNGADLKTAMEGLIADDHDNWSYWLFEKAREHNLFKEVVALGYRNSGNQNSGNRNSGNWNSGYRNSGYQNSGDWNSGNWNSGDWNSGYFNSKTPDEILVFNKMCKRLDWDNAYKPYFIYEIKLTYWVYESEMSDADKIADPHFHVRGGQLRVRTYKEAWKHAWDNANHDDRMRVKELPNFDADVFFEISGIDLRGDLYVEVKENV